jgi:hypothetical protein
MIEQIDKYWAKLFADPMTVQTPSGPITTATVHKSRMIEGE